MWDIIHFVAILILFFYIPGTFAQEFQLNNFICVSTAIIFITDSILTLNTAFYEKGKLIEKRITILKNYLSKRFVNDIITLMPIIYLLVIINYEKWAPKILIQKGIYEKNTKFTI